MMVFAQESRYRNAGRTGNCVLDENDRPIIDTERTIYPAVRPATITIPELAPAGAFRHLTWHC
jgi:hypothetical protein